MTAPSLDEAGSRRVLNPSQPSKVPKREQDGFRYTPAPTPVGTGVSQP
jgi:hypothetical protein